MSMKSKTRNAYVDFLKGIAILATVIGHLISDIPAGYMLFNIIYSFHMSLLFFLSAYVEEDNRENYTDKERSMLFKRASGTLLPYLSWSVLNTIFRGGISFDMKMEDWIAILFGYIPNGLWFLPVLFGLKIMHFFYWKICRVILKPALWKNVLGICFLECMVGLLALVTKHSFVKNMLCFAIPYFFAVLIVDIVWVRKIVESEWMAACAFLIYMVVFPFFSWGDAHWTTYIIRIGLSLCVIVICWKLQKSWGGAVSGWQKAISLFGRYSMAVYLLHGLFLIDSRTHLNQLDSGFAVAVLSTAEAVIIATICVVIGKLIEVSSLWTKILFGK